MELRKSPASKAGGLGGSSRVPDPIAGGGKGENETGVQAIGGDASGGASQSDENGSEEMATVREEDFGARGL
jgi:hypothetical protein